MKNNKGYTIIELMIVIIVVGVIAFVTINKASYAFSDNNEADSMLLKQRTELIEMSAIKYGEDHLEIFEESQTVFIRVSDLIENDYLLVDSEGNISGDSTFSSSQKIELVLKDEKVSAHIKD